MMATLRILKPSAAPGFQALSRACDRRHERSSRSFDDELEYREFQIAHPAASSGRIQFAVVDGFDIRAPFHYLKLNSTMQTGGRYKVQVIDRALAILEMLADEGPALTLAELAGRIRLPKSTVLRLLNVLREHRFVARDSRSGDYRLGLKLVELGTRASSQLDFVERARPHLERLMAATGETVFLSVLDGTEAVAVDRVESPRTVRVPLSIGGRTPAYCTANGKALLAFLPEAEIEARLSRAKLRRYTRNTIVTVSGLRNEFRRVRTMGYAIDHEEREEGLKCVAAPVRNHTGAVVASVGILGPAFRLVDRKFPAIAATVVEAADAVSTELGFDQPESLSRRKGAMP